MLACCAKPLCWQQCVNGYERVARLLANAGATAGAIGGGVWGIVSKPRPQEDMGEVVEPLLKVGADANIHIHFVYLPAPAGNLFPLIFVTRYLASGARVHRSLERV